MADKPVGTDLVTKLNAANMQPLWDMVWDGLGETPVPTSVRAHIQAQPVSPSDGKVYVASSGGWVAQNPQDIAGAIAGKLDIAGGTILGTLRVNGAVTLDSPATVPVGATGSQVPQVQEVVRKAGDTMVGPLVVPADAIGAQVPQVQEVVKKSGDTMTGQLALLDPVGDSNPTLLKQFASQIASPGYIKLPGGLIIQWGVSGTQQAVRAITFPIAFPTAVFVVVATPQANNDLTYHFSTHINTPTTTGFNCYSEVHSTGGAAFYGGEPIHWLAIGF